MNTTSKITLLMTAFAALLLGGCTGTRKPEPAETNAQARLTGQLPYNPLAWKPITTLLNPNAGTASTLYGNDAAVTYARSNADAHYPAGAVLALVTWKEREDPHWYGARIPGQPQAVEFVSIGTQPEYAVYRGSPLARADTAADQTTTRIDYITHQRAAVMP